MSPIILPKLANFSKNLSINFSPSFKEKLFFSFLLQATSISSVTLSNSTNSSFKSPILSNESILLSFTSSPVPSSKSIESESSELSSSFISSDSCLLNPKNSYNHSTSTPCFDMNATIESITSIPSFSNIASLTERFNNGGASLPNSAICLAL